jgi:hypothetical protein
MNRAEFMQYVCENFYDAGAYRLIDNILCYAENNFAGADEQYRFLCEMLDGTIGLTDAEIRSICL